MKIRFSALVSLGASSLVSALLEFDFVNKRPYFKMRPCCIRTLTSVSAPIMFQEYIPYHYYANNRCTFVNFKVSGIVPLVSKDQSFFSHILPFLKKK